MTKCAGSGGGGFGALVACFGGVACSSSGGHVVGELGFMEKDEA